MGLHYYQSYIVTILVLQLLLAICSGGAHLSRSSFPPEFIFGTSSSAYQYEGAVDVDGRGASIWDTFTVSQPEKIADRSSGAVADEFYYQYRDDIALMKNIGFDSHRFSISWPRILPGGRVSEGVNWEGVQFYNNLIDELLSNGIKPLVTLFHWDSPQALEDEYGGFLSHHIVEDFRNYAELCFKLFGDRVKLWTTINEANIYTIGGYDSGVRAPGRCSNYVGNCTEGNSATEPYIVMHNIVLAHAMAVNIYKDKYQAQQKGEIGIVVGSKWMVPKFETTASSMAASRALDFLFGWVVDPIMFGDYPETMRILVGNRLPKFSESESKLVKGSIDFLGVNYYTSRYAEDSGANSSMVNFSYSTDSHVNLTTERDGIPIGELDAAWWIYFYPKGIEELIMYIKRKYNNPPIYITENGVAGNSSSMLNDSVRIKYHHDHLSHLLKAIKAGADVRGYYAWTFLDDFEWDSGYTLRFGIIYVDFTNKLQRFFKDSALWFKDFLQKDIVINQNPYFMQRSQ